MAEFLYLYRGGSRPDSPADGEKTMQQWLAWFKDLGSNLKDGGQPLEPSGKVVSGKAKTITDGPYAEAKDLVGGFTLVEARDLSHAAELSKGCPIFDRGGTVEVRPIMKM